MPGGISLPSLLGTAALAAALANVINNLPAVLALLPLAAALPLLSSTAFALQLSDGAPTSPITNDLRLIHHPTRIRIHRAESAICALTSV